MGLTIAEHAVEADRTVTSQAQRQGVPPGALSLSRRRSAIGLSRSAVMLAARESRQHDVDVVVDGPSASRVEPEIGGEGDRHVRGRRVGGGRRPVVLTRVEQTGAGGRTEGAGGDGEARPREDGTRERRGRGRIWGPPSPWR